MKSNRSVIKGILILLCFSFQVAYAQETVELKDPLAVKVVVKLQFKNGSISDPAGKEGITMLTASVVSAGGTADMTSSQIKDFLYPMAINYQVSTDKEVTVFTFEMPAEFCQKFFPVMKGLILSPRFDENDFNRIKSNQQNFVDQVIRSSSDEEYSKKALENLLFRGSNYQHLVQGTSAGLKSITLTEIKKHYASFFTAKNVTIGIAGNYSAEFLDGIKATINRLPQTMPVIPKPGIARIPDGLQVEIISKDNALGSALFCGFPLAVTRSNDDFALLMIANSWLGEHRKSYSRLYQKIREQRSMNYGDYSYIEWYENGGQNMLPRPGYCRNSNYFSIWIRPVQTAKGLKGQYPELAEIKTGHAHFALRMAIREMDMLINKGLSKEDFELTRNFLISYVKLYPETPAKQLGFLMDSRFYQRKDYINELVILLEKATPEQVNAAIKKYWQTGNMFVTIVTDASEAENLAQSLLNNTPSPMSYSNSLKAGMPKSILDEDDIVSTYKLNVKKVDIIKSADTFK